MAGSSVEGREFHTASGGRLVRIERVQIEDSIAGIRLQFSGHVEVLPCVIDSDAAIEAGLRGHGVSIGEEMAWLP
jgi:hypothetical protein